MTAKTDLPPIPPALADVALIDGPTIAAACGSGISAFLDGVRRTTAGELRDGELPYPQPVIRQARYTRWNLAQIRAWLIERAARATHDAEVIKRATRASDKARAKREAAQAGA